MLTLYAEAVARMVANKDASDPLSWSYQWYTHAVPPPGKAKMLSTFFKEPGPALDLAKKTWSSCQPHNQDPTIENKPTYFLPWHRHYVLYFENIVRKVLTDAKVSGGDTFTLPYWDYVGGPKSDLSLPLAFRDKNSALFRNNRFKHANEGKPIDEISPLAKGTINLKALEEPVLDTSARGVGMGPSLNQNPHGFVHSYIGTPSNMGTPNTAAGDPIFWVHHCNIDRLWASWNEKAGGPNSDWGNKRFDFADDNRAAVAPLASDASTTKSLFYEYDELVDLKPIPKPVISAMQVAKPRTIASPASKGGVQIKSQVSNAKLGASFSLTQLATFRSDARYYLVLDGVMLRAPSTTAFNVFLNLYPDDSLRTPQDPGYVGTISLFDAPTMDHAHSDKHTITLPLGEDFPAFVQKLGGFPENVQLVAMTEVDPASQPTIGAVSILAV